MTVKFDIKNSVRMDAAQDPFNAVPKELKRTNIAAKIREYASKSVVPIIIKYYADGEEHIEHIQRTTPNYYDEETGIELYFDPNSFDFKHLGGASFFYRNAKVSGNTEILFLSPEVNIHYGSAKDLLTIDRGTIKDGTEITKKTIDAIVHFINSDAFNTMLSGLDADTKSNAEFKFSFFVDYYNKRDNIRKPLARTTDFQLIKDGDKIKLSEVLEAEKLRFRTSTMQALQVEKKDGEVVIRANVIPVVSPNVIVNIAKLIFKLASERHKHCYCTENFTENFFAQAEYFFTNEDIVPEIKLTMQDIKRNIESTQLRSYINFLAGYEDIKIPSDIVDSNIKESMMTIPIPSSKVEKMISPFIKINDKLYDCRNEELYKYVSRITGKDEQTVKAAYDRFVEDAVSAGVKLA